MNSLYNSNYKTFYRTLSAIYLMVNSRHGRCSKYCTILTKFISVTKGASDKQTTPSRLVAVVMPSIMQYTTATILLQT